MEISVGHTPDADDAFMFYGMFTGKITSSDFTVTHVIEDIENLNKKAINPLARCVEEISAKKFLIPGTGRLIFSRGIV